MNLIDLALLFLRTGVVSFGGGTSVVADLQHELVDRTGAITRDQFFTAFAIGQATPGTNTCRSTLANALSTAVDRIAPAAFIRSIIFAFSSAATAEASYGVWTDP